jgi:hypothetical protein
MPDGVGPAAFDPGAQFVGGAHDLGGPDGPSEPRSDEEVSSHRLARCGGRIVPIGRQEGVHDGAHLIRRRVAEGERGGIAAALDRHAPGRVGAPNAIRPGNHPVEPAEPPRQGRQAT